MSKFLENTVDSATSFVSWISFKNSLEYQKRLQPLLNEGKSKKEANDILKNVFTINHMSSCQERRLEKLIKSYNEDINKLQLKKDTPKKSQQQLSTTPIVTSPCPQIQEQHTSISNEPDPESALLGEVMTANNDGGYAAALKYLKNIGYSDDDAKKYCAENDIK